MKNAVDSLKEWTAETFPLIKLHIFSCIETQTGLIALLILQKKTTKFSNELKRTDLDIPRLSRVDRTRKGFIHFCNLCRMCIFCSHLGRIEQFVTNLQRSEHED